MVLCYLPYLLQKNGLSTYQGSEKLRPNTILNLSSSMSISFSSYQRSLWNRLVKIKALFKTVETKAIVWRIQLKGWLENDIKSGVQIRSQWCGYRHVHEVALSMEPRELSSWPHICGCFGMTWITPNSSCITCEFNESRVQDFTFPWRFLVSDFLPQLTHD